IAAAGRPSIFIGDPDGEIARLLIDHQAGLAVRQGDGEALADAIEYLRDDPEVRDQMGRNARALFDSRFDLPTALRKWETLFASCGVRPASDLAERMPGSQTPPGASAAAAEGHAEGRSAR
ncbi:MAG: hypothetical protein KKB37_00550, partial [Alphaproteobacteria bacterium]|nr:hypothetical protein [Alphaproteobacteria bacterium]